MSRTNNWQDHWLDLDCEGLPFKEWCRNSTKKPGFAHCRVCNLTLKYLNIGVRALKDHGKSKKHLENCKAVADISANRSCKISPSPMTDGKLENISYEADGKAVTCCDKKQTAGLSSAQAHQTLGTALGPVPYYQVSNNGNRNALVPVYPCFFCPEEFLSKHLLHDHQASCMMKPPVLHAVIPADSDCAPRILDNENPPSIGPKMNMSSCNKYSGWSFKHHLLWPSKLEFIAGLDLLPMKKAQLVSQRRRNTECENIDWEEEVPKTPTTPSSMRTPKLLISHLSRDSHDNYRRRLSFIVDGKEDKDKNSLRGGRTHEHEDHEHTDKQEKKMTVCKSLYNLDITSPLGQFVIKHFKGDPSLHILSDIESHCLTSSAPKSSSNSRLRVRNVTYPITFRGYPAKCGITTHQYKFNKSEVQEFMKTVNTGLNKRSRRLYRKMIPCKVLLKHVTKADLKYWIPRQNQLTVDLKPLSAVEIAFWTMPKPTPSVDSLSVFPNGLTLTSPNVNSILGLKTRQAQKSNKNLWVSSLTLSNFVSEETCAELVQNRKVLYRSLLSDCDSLNSNNVRFSKKENHCPTHSSPYSLLRQMLKASPKVCDFTSSEEKASKLSAVNIPVGDPHLCGSELHRDGKTISKGHKSTDNNKLSDSQIFQLTPIDIHAHQSTGNIRPPQSLSCKKRKLSHIASFEYDIDTVFQEKAKKFLGGFSVKVRPAKEGDIIRTFLENQQVHSFLSKRQDIDSRLKSEKIVPTTGSKRRAYTDQVTANEFSSRKRNLRSSFKAPLARPKRVKIKDRGTCLSDRSSNQNQHVDLSADFNDSKKRNRLWSKSSIRKCLKKEIAVQQTPKVHFSKTHQLKSPTCPSLEDNMRQSECKSQRSGQSRDSMILKQKLDAAGLVKRLPPLNAYHSHVSRRQMKPKVPTSNEISRNLSTSSSHISNNALDCNFVSGEHSNNHGLRKTKLQSSASSLVQLKQHVDRRKSKIEKHKNFMLWLQNLRKGNIT